MKFLNMNFYMFAVFFDKYSIFAYIYIYIYIVGDEDLRIQIDRLKAMPGM